MVNVDIDKELYEEIKEIVKKDRINFPSIRHFVHKHLLNKINDINNNNKK